MKRVAAEIVIPSGPLRQMTRMAFMQARMEFATPENTKLLGKIFGLEGASDGELRKLHKHVESVTFSSPLTVGRYYFPLLMAVCDEFYRRSVKSK